MDATDRQPSATQQRNFLKLTRLGVRRDEAAAEVGSTGTRFRALIRRDPKFRKLYHEAKGTTPGDAIVSEISDEFYDRMFDRDDPQSARLLIQAAEAALPEFAYKRQRKVEHSGAILHGHLDLTKLSDEQLRALEEIYELAAPEDDNVIEMRPRA